jgi:hypothetical protein
VPLVGRRDTYEPEVTRSTYLRIQIYILPPLSTQLINQLPPLSLVYKTAGWEPARKATYNATFPTAKSTVTMHMTISTTSRSDLDPSIFDHPSNHHRYTSTTGFLLLKSISTLEANAQEHAALRRHFNMLEGYDNIYTSYIPNLQRIHRALRRTNYRISKIDLVDKILYSLPERYEEISNIIVFESGQRTVKGIIRALKKWEFGTTDPRPS